MTDGTGSRAHMSGRPPEPDLAAGEMIGEYQIEACLGRGGMGCVYEAINPLIGKRAAVKIIHRELCENQESVARFVQEAKAVNRIGHPNIVDVFGLGTTDDGRAYLVMELLVGEPLAAWLAPERAPGLSVQSTCDILIEVSHALEAAHNAGIIHRDLKPDNIFLAQAHGGQTIVKLLDFGIAKLGIGEGQTQTAVDYTQPGVFVGTPKYIAPEQARGMPLAGTADIYALGAVAFELLGGRAPFVGNDAVELIAKHVTMQAPLASVFNPALAQIGDVLCARMLDKDPSRRPTIPEVREMLEALKLAPPRDPRESQNPAREKQTELLPLPQVSPTLAPAVAAMATPTHQAPTVPPGAHITAPAAAIFPPMNDPAHSAALTANALIPTEYVDDQPRRWPWWSFALAALGVLAFGVWLFGRLLDRNDDGPPNHGQAASSHEVGSAAPPSAPPSITPIAPPVTPDATEIVQLQPIDAGDGSSGSAASPEPTAAIGSGSGSDPDGAVVDVAPPPPHTPPVIATPPPRPPSGNAGNGGSGPIHHPGSTSHPPHVPHPPVTPPIVTIDQQPTQPPLTPTTVDHGDPQPATPKQPPNTGKKPPKGPEDDDALVNPFAHKKQP